MHIRTTRIERGVMSGFFWNVPFWFPLLFFCPFLPPLLLTNQAPMISIKGGTGTVFALSLISEDIYCTRQVFVFILGHNKLRISTVPAGHYLLLAPVFWVIYHCGFISSVTLTKRLHSTFPITWQVGSYKYLGIIGYTELGVKVFEAKNGIRGTKGTRGLNDGTKGGICEAGVTVYGPRIELHRVEVTTNGTRMYGRGIQGWLGIRTRGANWEQGVKGEWSCNPLYRVCHIMETRVEFKSQRVMVHQWSDSSLVCTVTMWLLSGLKLSFFGFFIQDGGCLTNPDATENSRHFSKCGRNMAGVTSLQKWPLVNPRTMVNILYGMCWFYTLSTFQVRGSSKLWAVRNSQNPNQWWVRTTGGP